MSGIVGLWRRDGRAVESHTIQAMLDALAERGSDCRSVWCDGPAGLGQCARWITPRQRDERQAQTASDGLVLTADARIDNRSELAGSLAESASTTTDADLLRAAYRTWGETCVERVAGDFSFAIWDPRARRLFCARDRFGVRPFHYYANRDMFAFASEIKALLALAEVPRRLDRLRVAQFLICSLEDHERTFYEEIKRLAPSHAMTVTADEVAPRRYWRLDPRRELRLKSDDDFARAFAEAFREAVRCRVRSERPVGSTLSGGLDSSSIACVARDLLGEGEPLHTFSATFAGLPERDLKPIDERRFVDLVIAQGGVVSHEIAADKVDPWAAFDRILEQHDEPVLTPNLYVHWGIYAAAQRVGVGVLLDGLDGDTTVSHGLGRFAELAQQFRLPTLWREARAMACRSPRDNVTTWQVIDRYGLRPLVPAGLRRLWRRLRGRYRAQPWGPLAAIHPDFAHELDLARRVRELQRDPDRLPRSARESHVWAFDSPLLTHALEVADIATSRFGFEARYPFFDHRLVELCVGLPADQKIRDGWTRYVLRRSLAGTVPDEVRWRVDKSNLSTNLRRHTASLAAIVEPILAGELPDEVAEFFDLSTLRRVAATLKIAPAGGAIHVVYGAALLVRWIELAQSKGKLTIG